MRARSDPIHLIHWFRGVPRFHWQVRHQLAQEVCVNLIDRSTWMSGGLRPSLTRRESLVIQCEQSKWVNQVRDFKLWCRERNMLTEISDADYREPRVSVTD